MKEVKIKYHKSVCFYVIIWPVVFIFIVHLVLHTPMTHITDTVFGLFLVYYIFKYFIPMANGKVALEVNENGIYDFIRNQNVSWDNITAIKKIGFIKNAQSFQIGFLLYETNEFIRKQNIIRKILCWRNQILYSTPFVITLHFLAGSNEQIFETIDHYFTTIHRKTGK